jgi:hypothetical protein
MKLELLLSHLSIGNETKTIGAYFVASTYVVDLFASFVCVFDNLSFFVGFVSTFDSIEPQFVVDTFNT